MGALSPFARAMFCDTRLRARSALEPAVSRARRISMTRETSGGRKAGVRRIYSMTWGGNFAVLSGYLGGAVVCAVTSGRRFGASAIPSEQLTELLWGQPGILNDPAHGERLDRVVPRNGHLPGAITHDDVFPLPNDLEPRLPQGTDGILMIDAGNARHDYTSSSRTSAPWSRSSRAARYSWMASRMFASASSSVSPSDQQPGSAGTETLMPSSVRWSATLYFMATSSPSSFVLLRV